MSNKSSGQALRRLVSRVLPAAPRAGLRRLVNGLQLQQAGWRLSRVRAQASTARPGNVLACGRYRVHINDGPNFYTLYKDIFQRRIYHFDTDQPSPRVLDCGSNIGMSILYFKHIYPQARVTGFEPDPFIWQYLQRNMAVNRMEDVQLIQAAVGARVGTLTFASDGKYSGFLETDATVPPPAGWARHQVPCVRLQDYLNEPVDFLKMNIEGAEYDTLADTGARLRQVKELVLEYHHLPGLPRTLHLILALLHEHGFEYLVNDLDVETNAAVEPPFQLGADSRYFLLVYARRLK